MQKKCRHSDGAGHFIESLSIGGFEIDPCIYEEVETIEHCTVHILKCQKCGHIEIEWEREDVDGEG